MRLAELTYFLPPELVAQAPAAERSAARLLVLDRATGALRHARVADLPALLQPHDVLVVNDTRVVPARVRARRPTGGRLEVLFVRPTPGDAAEWEVLVRGAPRVGERVHLPDATGEWTAALGDGRWRVRLALDERVVTWLERVGEVPLPPYVARPGGPSRADRERYQTVYARVPGAVAAPTAGLHLTEPLLEALGAAGVALARLTLHVGPGTFLPIRTDDLDAHTMLPEPYEIPPGTVDAVAAARGRGGRVVAVGTTTVRALESATRDGRLVAGQGEATLFIRPGYAFRAVDVLLTNFHLPQSTLLALVAAFAGWERIRAAYAEAVRLRYRFYSFGDAMLLA
ncbi:MAG TPA: tRNA preQ1(34) S-adenosylmethionine ribosyltransferase-isomerase QueA [Candidatus Binatia bacterium]|nr:tRNA preQ1(34) S-adenosylmethionine ribosyltransferase-isomerase QueA [Candidatus Binatia bacterium]